MDTTSNLIATATIAISADRDQVWHALVDPDSIRKYMFGTTVTSSWTPGEPITWTGEWKGNAYQDKGTILVIDPGNRLSYSHFSPMTGQPDIPENYHTVSIELNHADGETRVTLTQDGNATEEAKEHSQKNWTMMLEALKAHVEESAST